MTTATAFLVSVNLRVDCYSVVLGKALAIAFVVLLVQLFLFGSNPKFIKWLQCSVDSIMHS